MIAHPGMADVAITERLLMDAGGWQAMKQARALVQMGRVSAAEYRAPLLQGRVREGETEYRCGLKIRTATDVENLCSCRASQNFGVICAHSLAVGLRWLAPTITPPTPRAVSGASKPAPVESGPLITTDGPGPLLELSVVLPPNFLSAWERGAVTLGFEAHCEGRRVLASALPASGKFRASEGDARVLAAVRRFADGGLPGMVSLARDDFLEALDVLRGFARLTLGRGLVVTVAEQALRPELTMRHEPDGALTLAAQIPSGNLLVGGRAAWWYGDRRFAPVAPGLSPAYLPVLNAPVRLSAEQAGSFAARELPGLAAHFQVPNVLPVRAAEPGRPDVIATVEGSLNHLAVRLQFRYGKRIVSWGVTPASDFFVYPTPDGPRTRNAALEKRCADEVEAAGFRGPSAQGEFVLRGERLILDFFARDLPRWQSRWEVSVGSRFAHVSRDLDRVSPRLEVLSSGEDWFEFSYTLESSSGDRFSAADVQRLLRSGRTSAKAKDGRTAVFNGDTLSEIEAVLAECQGNQVRPGRFRVHRREAAFLDASFRELPGGRVQGDVAWERLAAEPGAQAGDLRPADHPALAAVLRDYQKRGVAWMQELRRNGAGGILADEMGLGKTLQALAFLTTVPGPSLVVCPASLVFNWQREAARFAPNLRLLTIAGPDRAARFNHLANHDLVLTSYPLLRRDAAQYRSVGFGAIILDEATHIKNPDTQNAQAAGALRARHRFVLTGTPIENSVRDLWSIANFVMPGYLGTREDFRERYELPIGRGSPGEGARLARRLRPILLRRRKTDVVRELPQKIEQVAFCELTGAQRELYEKLHRHGRETWAKAGAKDTGSARLAVLTALLRMRQACCDLRLLDPAEKVPSAKVDLWAELLEEAIDGGHRVLVFSQFVTMLKLLRTELAARDVPACYLDGGTRDRGAEVDRFQSDDGPPVFLISLKAGGTGLNLAAADTVLHFDPWWNPAVEDQATDRAHRIGQTRVVTSYKLIARDTVEEKILRLQERKRAVTAAALESEEPVMAGLTSEEVAELLA